jgi:hypothetical protein
LYYWWLGFQAEQDTKHPLSGQITHGGQCNVIKPRNHHRPSRPGSLSAATAEEPAIRGDFLGGDRRELHRQGRQPAEARATAPHCGLRKTRRELRRIAEEEPTGLCREPFADPRLRRPQWRPRRYCAEIIARACSSSAPSSKAQAAKPKGRPTRRTISDLKCERKR